MCTHLYINMHAHANSGHPKASTGREREVGTHSLGSQEDHIVRRPCSHLDPRFSPSYG